MTGPEESLVRWLGLEEALSLARSQRKPVYLFLGSRSSSRTMAMVQESLSDQVIADLINCDFAPLLVDPDREPLLAEMVRLACQVMNGQCEEPINLFTTPDLKPFFAASYMPKKGNPKQPGLSECLPRIKWLWLMKNEAVILGAEENMELLFKNGLSSSEYAEYINHSEDRAKRP